MTFISLRTILFTAAAVSCAATGMGIRLHESQLAQIVSGRCSNPDCGNTDRRNFDSRDNCLVEDANGVRCGGHRANEFCTHILTWTKRWDIFGCKSTFTLFDESTTCTMCNGTGRCATEPDETWIGWAINLLDGRPNEFAGCGGTGKNKNGALTVDINCGYKNGALTGTYPIKSVINETEVSEPIAYIERAWFSNRMILYDDRGKTKRKLEITFPHNWVFYDLYEFIFVKKSDWYELLTKINVVLPAWYYIPKNPLSKLIYDSCEHVLPNDLCNTVASFLVQSDSTQDFAGMENVCWYTKDLGLEDSHSEGVHSEPWLAPNELPTWNNTTQEFTLEFRGRAHTGSIHNFQLKSSEDGEIILTLGKVTNEAFHLDFKHPLTKKQAFAIAVATLTRTGARASD